MQTTSREFSAHKNLLVLVMQAQAGTLGKALMEAVMNSCDAGATHVTVLLTETSFAVRDNGRGIQTLEQVENWFETFGTPHEADDQSLGKFRQGRGQLFSFARNTWRTSTFRMVVDIKNGDQLGYDLTEGLTPIKGTRIDGELYEQLSASSVDEIGKEFAELVRYSPIPVTLNGKLISRKVTEMKWDQETDDAYIKTTREGDLKVYNRGFLVKGFSNYHLGTGGIVVSKNSLELNTARNDILQHKCSIWRRVSDKIREISFGKVTGKTALTKQERDFLASQWVYRELPGATKAFMPDVKLFTDVSGRHWSLNDLRHQEKLTVARGSESKIGSRLHREREAFVLSEDTLSRFRVDSLNELVEFLADNTGVDLRDKKAEFAELAMGSSDHYKVFEDSELTLKQQIVLSVLRQKAEKFVKWFEEGDKASGMRTLVGGSSGFALAWTDGSSFVAYEQKQLDKAADGGVAGFFDLLLTTVHEFCHDSRDLESHEHDMVFYARHHDIIQYKGARLLKLAQEMHSLFLRAAKKGGVDVSPTTVTSTRKAVKTASTTSQRAEMFAKAQLNLFQ
ncbi:ATP-binding protein [Burkholderia cenocepacia]|uniref:ATP-binding protein n=1 Tax=Burkholderia cenocepacia TaxID=95486 RepID=UPI000761B2C2|nr:ATP-binding protein [Burkholderia cenocepacia]KWU17932.1 hypothetical protein AS149_14760 [Burkholderia cenocepacia]